jgi:hypothetical protein
MTDSASNSDAGDANVSPALRWVVLYHDEIHEPHFDLMIESQPGGFLHTWRCGQNPVGRCVTSAIRIANHRRHYLDYEGPVSGGRGRVTRVAAGSGRLRRVTPRAWLWEPGPDALYVTYRMAPAPVRMKSRGWIIEGKDATAGNK